MKYAAGLFLVLCASISFAGGIWQKGSTVGGILDFREVMPGLLYRGGSGGGRTPLNTSQKNYLCGQGIGTAIYVYSQGFTGNSEHACSGNSMSYRQKTWDRAYQEIHRLIYNSIKSDHKPVFLHCWYGIHATGFVAATALMQFCDMSAADAVKYWKVGIVPKLQYPHVIKMIEEFRPNTSLTLSASEQARFCPR